MEMMSNGRPIFILDPTESFFECLFCLARFHQDLQSALDGVPTPAALGAEKYENAGPLLTRNLKQRQVEAQRLQYPLDMFPADLPHNFQASSAKHVVPRL